MAVKKGLKVGDTFEDNGIKYRVKSVNKDGSYVSVRADKEPEKKAGKKAPEKTEETFVKEPEKKAE